MIRLRIIAAVLILSSAIGLIMPFSHTSAVTGYGKVNIINDSVMNNINSMSSTQINTFLNGFTGTCLGTNSGFSAPDPQGYANGGYQFGSNVDAGTAVSDIARHYNLNPQVLLTTLEKEQGLIDRNGNCAYANPAPAPTGASCNSPGGGTGPNYCSYACQNTPQGGCAAVAVGYACPGYCRNTFLGFSQQLSGASWVLRFAEARAYGQLSGYSGYDSGDENVCYTGPMTAGYRQRSNSAITCDGVTGNQSVYYDGSYTDSDGNTMYIANGSTASMLNYTPFYARSYTNSGLFHTAFTKWFGNPAYPPSTVYLPNGTYSITGVSSGKSIDVPNNSPNNGIDLQLYSSNNTSAQKWVLTQDSNGYYTIKNASSGKYVDVSAAGTQPATSVDIWNGNGTCAQNWAIQTAGNGYTFYNTCSGLALDVSGGGTTNGASLQVYTPNSTPAQQWNLTNLDSPVLSNGFYKLLTSAGTSLDITNGATTDGAAVQIYTNNGTGSQSWLVTRLSNGLYKLYNPQSGKYLDVISAGTTAGTKTQIFDGDSSCAQQWAITANSDGSYGFSSACSGLQLDVSGGAVSTNGTPVQIYTSNGTSAQEWTLQAASRTIADGSYNLLTSAGTALDVTGGSTNQGAQIQIYTKNNTGSQVWQVVRQNNGLYDLYNPQSGKYLDVIGASAALGTHLQLWPGDSTCAQQWAVTVNNDGTDSLASSCSGLQLDVSGGAVSTNGTPVQIYTSNGTGAQEWTLR